MSRAIRNKRLAELRALRASGKKTFDSFQVEDQGELYEEVDEEEYKKIVRKRLDQDDFVIDDNGGGYVDDGREDWGARAGDSESEEESVGRSKHRKTDKRKREEDKAKKEANDRDIQDFFGRKAPPPKQKKMAKTEAEDQFMKDLLSGVDLDMPNMPAPKPRESKYAGKRQRSPLPGGDGGLSPLRREARLPAFKKARLSGDRLSRPDGSVGAEGATHASDDLPQGIHDLDMSDHGAAPSSPIAQVVQRKARVVAEARDEAEELAQDLELDLDLEEEEEMMEVAHAAAVQAPRVNLEASKPVKKLPKPDLYPTPASSSPTREREREAERCVDSASWNELGRKLNVVETGPEDDGTVGRVAHGDALEEDGSLNFFWIDYTEVNGSLCLFGKVLNKKTGSYVSCFVKIDNVLRKLYFLPRQYRREGGRETDEEVTMADVYAEVDEMMSKMNVGMHKIKACSRKYAFELPDIPREAQYLKLLYPYTKPAMAAETTGKTFSHVFGAGTALFEQFVLWKDIKGPCWLSIRQADLGSVKNASHARVEVLVAQPNMVSTLSAASESDNLDAPPLTLMSLALRTTFNAKENQQEIVAISARVYDSLLLTATTPAERLPCRTLTLIRPHGAAFPLGFEKLAAERKKGVIKPMKRETEILSFFLAQLDAVDPDVILGHQLEGVGYSILLSRLQQKKTAQWSRLGRLRRMQWPGSMGKLGGNVFAERQILAGRLLCDLANDAGKSVMYKCQSWSLSEMVALYLGGEKRRELDSDAALASWAGEKQGLMDYVAHMEADTHYVAALALRTQMLPLTKVLTNLAGNSWARTLTGTRAERNEYILLHEFHRNKYICPDKQTFKGRAKADHEADEAAADGKKKDKFKGGLVFEPEKGLYDKFVLVMDFNSLYPSIIQEYNICFTTVHRRAQPDGNGNGGGGGGGDGDGNDEAVPDVPAEQELGILPKLISNLVSRRRQVKSLMKDKSATAEQLATWEIKQLALKLTANSMYGCLGYTKSRFYARPLAVLTTFKGREILRSTKDLAESMSLQVIYGDTDSVMINANVDCVADALKVGRDFKKAVNDRYRLLEIDIDNVFRRILLQAKKKYAAISLVNQAGGKWEEKIEVKGLDMKRREYCALSKEMSARILNDILSGDDSELSIRRVHDYLAEMAAKMRAHAIPVQKYIIFTQLGKAPKDYPNADSMPQVQVALRDMARGKNVRRGDVISYVVTAADSPTSSEPVAKRAYAPQDVMKEDSGLKLDVEWYLAKQIFPPVERLCANIVGTSTAQLADLLGLDVGRYANKTSANQSASNDLQIHPLESQIPDKIRFADCARLSLRCRKCRASSTFEGLVGHAGSTSTSSSSSATISPQGVQCGACTAPLSTLTIVAQVEAAVRAQTARYYEAWLVCDDVACGIRTRHLSVYGDRCLGPEGRARGCLGRMRYECGERDVYNQLVYFASLWDVDRARDRVTAAGDQGRDQGHDRERVLALAEHNRVRFGTVRAVVDRYLDKCGRRWVAMDSLFGRLGLVAAAP